MSALNGQRAAALREGLRVNVAILGAGRIAHSMAQTLNLMAQDERYSQLVEPYAVASRDRVKAQQFADQYGFPRAYGSYEELIADPHVDLVYIATPHNLHAEQAIACIKGGKNVLVEKSFTANGPQAREIFDALSGTGLLCTEAIWTRYMPSRAILQDILASGELGQIQAITADLGYPVSDKPRMSDPNLAGGALLDVGMYPLNFIDMVMAGAKPERIETSASFTQAGVDEQNATTLYYENGVMAIATSSMIAATPRQGQVWCSNGYVIAENINNIAYLDVFDANYERIRCVDVPAQLTGYEYQVADAACAILDGKSECAAMPHSDTLRIMELMDSIRDRWGLRYPFEQ